ncbi:hypothetical protein EP7_004368 [Isosphaeraceae bacterium EP7]
MRPRHADVLKESGYAGDLETFRETLAAVKAELYPDITDEILAFGKETSATYCATVRKRLNAPRLGRVFILKGLISLRKHGWRPQTVGS